MSKSKPAKRGPKPEVLAARGADWKDALKHAMGKKKPTEGWPKPEPKAKK